MRYFERMPVREALKRDNTHPAYRCYHGIMRRVSSIRFDSRERIYRCLLAGERLEAVDLLPTDVLYITDDSAIEGKSFHDLHRTAS
jgi:hypothetical protein